MSHALGNLIGNIVKAKRSQEEIDHEKELAFKLMDLHESYATTCNGRPKAWIEDSLVLVPAKRDFIFGIEVKDVKAYENLEYVDYLYGVGLHFKALMEQAGVEFGRFRVRFLYPVFNNRGRRELQFAKEHGDKCDDVILADILTIYDPRTDFLACPRSRCLPSGLNYHWGKAINAVEVK